MLKYIKNLINIIINTWENKKGTLIVLSANPLVGTVVSEETQKTSQISIPIGVKVLILVGIVIGIYLFLDPKGGGGTSNSIIDNITDLSEDTMTTIIDNVTDLSEDTMTTLVDNANLVIPVVAVSTIISAAATPVISSVISSSIDIISLANPDPNFNSVIANPVIANPALQGNLFHFNFEQQSGILSILLDKINLIINYKTYLKITYNYMYDNPVILFLKEKESPLFDFIVERLNSCKNNLCCFGNNLLGYKQEIVNGNFNVNTQLFLAATLEKILSVFSVIENTLRRHNTVTEHFLETNNIDDIMVFLVEVTDPILNLY